MKLKLEGGNGNTTQGRFTKCVIGLVAKVQRMNNIIYFPEMLFDYKYDIMRLGCSESALGKQQIQNK